MQNWRFHPRPTESESACLTRFPGRRYAHWSGKALFSDRHCAWSITYNSWWYVCVGLGWQMDTVSFGSFWRSPFSPATLPPWFPPFLAPFLPPPSLFLPPTCTEYIFLFLYGNIETIETCFCFPPSLGAVPFHLWFSQFPSKLNIKQIGLLTADPKWGHGPPRGVGELSRQR